MVVGALFIIATVAGVVGNLGFSTPLLDSPDYLTSASASGNNAILGAVFEMIGALAAVSIAIWLYPVLRRYNEGLALGAVGFRLVECVLYVIAIVALLSILTLSREFVIAGAADASVFRAAGTSLQAVRDWAGQLSVVAFAPAALMYYSVFYQSRLIPQWLSGWGFIAAALCLSAALLRMFGLIVFLSPVFLMMVLPLALQEMVLAVWLIARGFNRSAIASLST
jgi:hypothetical protein